jgi:broad specificity phosphatase PhoE
MTKSFAFLVLAALLLTTAVNAQEVLFFIRHAEKEVTGDDPGLTQEGRARSAAWASFLGHAEIDQVITTDARRSQQTGDIIAQVLGLAQTQIAMQDVTGLIDALEFEHSEDRVLIVGHTETIPSILFRIGHPDMLQIDQEDFSNLFVFTPGAGEGARLIHMQMP